MNPNDEMPGYVSSAPELIQQDQPHPKDEAELSTLDEILALCDAEMAYYNTNDSVALDSETLKVFSAEAQLAINKKTIQNINTLRIKLATAINKVREKQSGREF